MRLNFNLTLLLTISLFLASCGNGQYVNVRPGSTEVKIASASDDLSRCTDTVSYTHLRAHET